jgi:predicted ABC-type ATPase
MANRSLIVIAGPNGSGKSTLISHLVKSGINLGVYINADDIELGLGHISDLQLRSREAQRLADKSRAECLSAKKSFSFETVMSHPSKIDLMREARQGGYHVMLAFVAVSDPGVNVGRVAARVSQGGHNVPEDRILARYKRTLALLSRAILASDKSILFDNTRSGRGPTAVAEFVRRGDGFDAKILDPGCAWLQREMLSSMYSPDEKRVQTDAFYLSSYALSAIDALRTADLTFP